MGKSGAYISKNCKGFQGFFGYMETWWNISKLFGRISYQGRGQDTVREQIKTWSKLFTENRNELILTL